MKKPKQLWWSLSLLLLMWQCGDPKSTTEESDAKEDESVQEETASVQLLDPHSYAREDAIIKHLRLNIEVLFDKSKIMGRAEYIIEKSPEATAIYFDTRGLEIYGVENQGGKNLDYELGEEDPIKGRPLKVAIDENTKKVTINYSTTPEAEALQWLPPEQTAGKEHPFLFTQSQAILARTWLPIQDSPGIRFTYKANVKVPKELMALMSAVNPTEKSSDGVYHFEMNQPIPAYLMALSVGDLTFQPLSENTGVYAEPSMIEAAAYELEEMPDMLEKSEALYGDYRWEQYDVLFLPPSFPFGGMENPRLTFATPTIIAGDRSLTALIAHELAHSWSGNLVTNAVWDDFWLNEGFTVYFERRIMEALYGKDYSDMLNELALQSLKKTIEKMGEDSPRTHLKLDLEGKDPDEGLTRIAYDKGALLLIRMEKEAGREKMDAFLKNYFNDHAFQTITTEAFLEYYEENLIKGDDDLRKRIAAKKWIYGPGLPDNCPEITSDRFRFVEAFIEEWAAGEELNVKATDEWSTHEWLYFLRNLPEELNAKRMAYLDEQFAFTGSQNAEIQAQWYLLAIENEYERAYPALEQFLIKVGRRKFLMPLYEALLETPEGHQFAVETFDKAKDGYHAISRNSIQELLEKSATS